MADNEHPAGPPPREAIDYLRRKGMRAGWDYREVWREEHAHAFTVANMMMIDLLVDVRDSIAAAEEEGTTKERWKQDMTAALRKRGWWGRKEDDAKAARALKDELRRAEAKGAEAAKIAELKAEIAKREAALDLYVSRRLDTIWRVNMWQAAQAGAWERGQRSTSHPYVLYRIGPSKVHREQHEAWNGLLLRKDDPFWSVANPMNGWGCKCYTRFVSEAQRRRYERDGVAGAVVGDGEPGKMAVQTDSPTLEPQQYRNTKTGKIHTGYRGIDPGFERNPGVGRGEQIGEQFDAKDERLRLAFDVQPAREADAPPVADAVTTQDRGRLRQALHTDLDAIKLIHGAGPLPAMNVAPVPGADSACDVPAGAMRIGEDYPLQEIVLLHEIGHLIDEAGLPGDARESDRQTLPGMQAVMRAIYATGTYAQLHTLPDDDSQYLRDPPELFARAYAQYIAWRSGDPTLKEQIDRMLRDQDSAVILYQWSYAEFLPIAEAMDALFEAQGWLTRR